MDAPEAITSQAAPPPSPAEHPDGSLARRVAGSASNLAGRRFVLMAVSGLTAAAVTRILGPTTYGSYGAAIATWTLVGAAADFGFSLSLSRDLARDPTRHGSMLRAAYQVGFLWSVPLALLLAGLAVAADVGTPRGACMLILAPSVLAFGLIPARTVFIVRYRTREMVLVDVGVAVVQSAGMVGVAAAGLGAPAVAAVVSVTTAVNVLLVALLARRYTKGASAPFSRRRFVRRSAPLGLLSVMTQVYLMIDLVIIGWYITGPSVGDYAASSRILTIFTGVAGLVTSAALPAFSSQRDDRPALEEMIGRVWHWLAVTALPLFVGLALFAPLAVAIAIGPQYDGAIGLLRVLAVAGMLSVMANFLGTLMVATDRIRTLFIQNVFAITLNVGGNIVLLPRYGVMASAWLTAATELLVVLGAVFVMRRQLSFRAATGVTGRPVIAMALAVAAALALSRWEVPAAAAAGLIFAAAVSALRGWPPEFRLRVPPLPIPGRKQAG
jgi:O-antigen/teichoic acid export membrane protein